MSSHSDFIIESVLIFVIAVTGFVYSATSTPVDSYWTLPAKHLDGRDNCFNMVVSRYNDSCNTIASRVHTSYYQVEYAYNYINQTCAEITGDQEFCLTPGNSPFCYDTTTSQPNEGCAQLAQRTNTTESVLLSNNKFDENCSTQITDQLICISQEELGYPALLFNRTF